MFICDTFQLDSNETGYIDFPEFLAYVSKKQREAAEDPVSVPFSNYLTGKEKSLGAISAIDI